MDGINLWTSQAKHFPKYVPHTFLTSLVMLAPSSTRPLKPREKGIKTKKKRKAREVLRISIFHCLLAAGPGSSLRNIPQWAARGPEGCVMAVGSRSQGEEPSPVGWTVSDRGHVSFGRLVNQSDTRSYGPLAAVF